ncbi:vegetative incompatibility protein HET-E-1 [Penicillium brasilianum]|uniref:Vegetative incompatibility protein HET-E-1 n=1 Tax=Penicillium brasilianum TaxID=104259 RepID=A0A1S9RL30_PENBI|nr:vegetative incompatibility protein HET-E-1 [Penicillium brasilianum]
MERQITKESLAEARPGNRPTGEAHTVHYSFSGDGLQNSGSGNIIVGRDVNIGMVLTFPISPADVLLGNWKENTSDCERALFVTDPYDDKQALKRKKGDHTTGTCEWILRTKELAVWLSSEMADDPQKQANRVLWLHGNPGAGKSIMAIYLTEELPTALSNTDGDEATLAYFFCDSGFHTRRTATSIVRGLLYQLVRQHKRLLDYILPNYRSRGAKLFTSFDALWSIFMAMVADQSIGRTYCIIDALDECDHKSQQILLQQLEETFNSRNPSPNVRILVTSRPYPEIRESLQIFPNKDLASFPERKGDIDLCIEERLNFLAKRKKYPNKVKEQVRKILRDKAEGTFLWVGLACEELKDIPSSRVISTLQDIPKGLQAIYKKLLKAAWEQNETSGDDLRRLLSYVVVSSRPLTVSELCEACELHQDEEDFETRIQFTHENIDSCRLMVVIRDERVVLLHQSMKDYLLGASSGYFIQEPEAHARLAYRCVDFLIAQLYSTNHLHTGFMDYATFQWAHHARKSKSKSEAQCEQADFFQLVSPCRDAWLQRIRSAPGLYHSAAKSSIFHVAAVWSIAAIVDHVSELGSQETLLEISNHVVHVNCSGDGGGLPLDRAAKPDYPNAVAALLSRGGEVTARTAIAAAENWGQEKRVRVIFLDRRGDQITITDEIVKAAPEIGGMGTK